MACERPKPFHVHETHSHFGNPFLQKSFRLLGNRLWHVICAHNRYGEWMIGEASGIVGRFESRLRQQRNHTIFPASEARLISTTNFLPGREAIKSGAAPRSRGCLTTFQPSSRKRLATTSPSWASWSGDGFGRSEERRVGKECRSRWSTDHLKKILMT